MIAPVKPLVLNSRQGNVFKMEGGGFVPMNESALEGFKEDVLGNLRRAIRKHSTDLISDASLIQPLAAELGVYEAVMSKVANDVTLPAEPATTEPETPAT